MAIIGSPIVSMSDADVVLVQDAQPTVPNNKIWVKETQPEGTEIPTYAEFLALEARVRALEDALTDSENNS